MRSWILAVLFILPFHLQAGEPENVWEAGPETCASLAVPQFQDSYPAFEKSIVSGQAWEKNTAQEKIALTKMTDITCPAYLAHPNGDTALPQFTADYSQLAVSALQSKQQSLAIAAFFDAESKVAKQYLLQFGVVYESTPCSKALEAAKTHMKTIEAAIETQFSLLRSKCPQIADAEAQEVMQKRMKAKEAQNIHIRPKVDGQPHTKDSSTVTGLKHDEDKQKQGQ